MKGIFDDIEDVIVETQHYADAKMEETKLETIQKTVEIGSLLTTWLLIGIITLLVLVAISILGGLLLTKLFGSVLIGISIITSLYIVVLIILYTKRDTIAQHSIPNIGYGKYLNARKNHE